MTAHGGKGVERPFYRSRRFLTHSVLEGTAYEVGQQRGEYLHLDWFGINPDLHRQGLGRFLLLTVMERAARDSFWPVGLGCDTRNAQAIALYRALGW